MEFCFNAVCLMNTIEVMLNGLMVGVMYALVALGFVLIFKSSGIFNFAQGVMAIFAAMTMVAILDGQVPFAHLLDWLFGLHFERLYDVEAAGGVAPAWLTAAAIVGASLMMILLAWLVVRLVLKPLVNQPGIILFMATIGLFFVIEGMGELMWGANIKNFDIGIPKGGSIWWEEVTDSWLPVENVVWRDMIEDMNRKLDTEIAERPWYFGMFVERLDVTAAVVALVLVIVLTLFSQYTRMGKALRAVADDHQAALSVGISLETIWWIVWSISGIVALVAGIMWTAGPGASFSLADIALKALPVLMLGGFTSIPGAIIGGLLIGVGEKLFEFLIGQPYLGGATETWFAFVLALIFLLFRPQGLFGEKIIERV